jgi:hypothetical protein
MFSAAGAAWFQQVNNILIVVLSALRLAIVAAMFVVMRQKSKGS